MHWSFVFGRAPIVYLLALGLVQVAWSPLFAQGNPLPPVQDPQQQGDGNPANSVQSPANLQDDPTIQRLMLALDQMIPGEYDKSSAAYQQLLRASDLFRTRKPSEAMAIFDKLRETDPQFPPSSLLMAGMYYAVNDSNTGKVFLEKTALEHPDYPDSYSGFARVAVGNRRFTDAFALMTVMKAKMDAGTWSKEQMEQFEIEWLDIMTDVAIAREKLDEANQYLSRLKVMLPENHKVPLRLAEVAFKQDKISEAITLLNRARELESNVFVAPLVIANWYKQAGDQENHDRWIEQAAAEFPEDKNIQLEYSRWLIQQGRLSKANIWINKAEANGANEVTTTFMKGQVAFLKKAFDVAELHFTRIHNSQPANIDAANLLALSLVESQSVDKQRKALELATVSVRMQPKNVVSISVLGWVNFKIGNKQRAAQLLQQAAQTPRLPPECAYFVAEILLEQKRAADALKVLDAIGQNKGIFLYRTQASELAAKIREENPSLNQASQNANDKNQNPGNDK